MLKTCQTAIHVALSRKNFFANDYLTVANAFKPKEVSIERRYEGRF